MMNGSHLREGFMGSDFLYGSRPRNQPKVESSFRGELNQVAAAHQTLPHISAADSFTDGNYTITAEKNRRAARDVLETKLRVRVKVWCF